jgi:hypothetical protein
MPFYEIQIEPGTTGTGPTHRIENVWPQNSHQPVTDLLTHDEKEIIATIFGQLPARMSRPKSAPVEKKAWICEGRGLQPEGV